MARLERHSAKVLRRTSMWNQPVCGRFYRDGANPRQFSLLRRRRRNVARPYPDESTWHGREKYRSSRTPAPIVVVVGCSNCHDQLMKRLPKHYQDYKYEVRYYGSWWPKRLSSSRSARNSAPRLSRGTVGAFRIRRNGVVIRFAFKREHSDVSKCVGACPHTPFAATRLSLALRRRSA